MLCHVISQLAALHLWMVGLYGSRGQGPASTFANGATVGLFTVFGLHYLELAVFITLIGWQRFW